MGTASEPSDTGWDGLGKLQPKSTADKAFGWLAGIFGIISIVVLAAILVTRASSQDSSRCVTRWGDSGVQLSARAIFTSVRSLTGFPASRLNQVVSLTPAFVDASFCVIAPRAIRRSRTAWPRRAQSASVMPTTCTDTA